MEKFNAEESYNEWNNQTEITPGEWMDMIREQYSYREQSEFWEYFRKEHIKPISGELLK